MHTAVTVLLLSWTAFIVNVNSKPENCSIRSSTSRNTAYITCYPLQEISLSLIVSDLPTNGRAYLQGLTDSKPNLFYLLFFEQFTVWMAFLFVGVIQPSTCHTTVNWVDMIDLCALQVWLGSRVVSVLDSGAVGPGFKSQPRRCRVTVLGKLFTPIVPLFTKQQNW